MQTFFTFSVHCSSWDNFSTPIFSRRCVNFPWKFPVCVGVIKFRQASHFDSTEVYVNIKGLASEATNVLIHQFPRRQRILAKEDLCTAQLVGNIYNPLETKQSAVNSSTATQDELPIGDLSAKYGNLTGKDMLEEEYFDSNLPLFGPLSVVGRSVMIYKSNGSRWMCSNIWSNGDAIIARVRLYYTVGKKFSALSLNGCGFNGTF